MTNTKNLANLAAALDDGTSGQVLQSTGSGGVQFADSTGSGVTVHANQAAMLTDAASASEGSLHYETGTNKLYVKQTSGFYLLASITNVAPTIDSFSENTGGAGANNLTAGGTFTLTAGSNTVVTINATEPDLETISYSATVTSGTATDVFSSPSFPVSNQSSNVFTLTPVTSGTGGTVTIRFDASDGTNIANVSHSFEIVFQIADSHYTSLLMATDGSAGDNNDITDSSSNAYTITASGDAHAGTFSPYRHGGYSTFFNGSSDYLAITNSTDFQILGGDFTVECWIYLTETQSNDGIIGIHNNSNDGWFIRTVDANTIRFYSSAGTADRTYSMDTHKWYHIAVSSSSNVGTLYVNGSSVGTTFSTNGTNNTGNDLQIGRTTNVANHFPGYITDVRIVKGTAVYTSNFTPTSTRLTAVTNTKLLTCHLPYIADGSSSSHSITVNGNTSTKPFGPYDYQEYASSTDGGSVYFDGSDYIDTNTAINFSSGGCIEGWVYITTASNYAFFIASEQGTTGYPRWYIGHSNVTDWRCSPGDSTDNNITSYDLIKNQWNHFVLSNDGSTSRLFANGVLIFTKSVTPINETLEFNFSKYGNTANYYMTGHLSDIRIDTTIPTAYQTSSTTIGTSVFTPPTQPLSSTGADFHMKGTDAHVIDKSQGNNLKLVGTAASTSALTSGSTPPYIGAAWANTSAVSFDGNSDYVIMPQIPLGSGDFTIEAYTYLDARLTSFPAIFSNYSSFSAGSLGLFAGHNSKTITNYQVSHNGAGFASINGGPITYDQWVHLCLERYNGTITLYKDGSSVGSFASTATLNGVGSNFYIGTTGDSISTGYINGWIQDFRVTVGKARYQGAFTKPAAPLKG